MMNEGVWRKGNAVRTGRWEYMRAFDAFVVYLDKPVAWDGGTRRRLVLRGEETPEWGQWRLDRSMMEKFIHTPGSWRATGFNDRG